MIQNKMNYKLFLICTALTLSLPAISIAEDNCLDVDGDGWGVQNGVTCQKAPNLKISKHEGCKNSNSDKDGDGWGWENNETCVSKSNPLYQYLNFEICSKLDSDPDKDGWGWENNTSCISRFSNIPNLPIHPECNSASSDSDNDGWGWENGISCRIKNIIAENICKDSDGDGWGWNEATQTSCRTRALETEEDSNQNTTVANSETNTANRCVDEDGDGWGWNAATQTSCSTQALEMEGDSIENTATASTNTDNNCVDDNGDGWGWDSVTKESCEMPYVPTPYERPENLEDVTDVIISAGQSNALGETSKYNENLDQPHPRVLVWSMEHGWQKADLKTQVWWTRGKLTNKNPFGTRPENFGKGQNHGGFQIAKAIAESDPKKVVALIATGDPGKPIANWDSDKEHYNTMIKTVNKAMAALPNKKTVDLVWWMQGESDARDTPIYEEKLYNLLDRLRSHPWYGQDGYFIANETARYEINKLFRRLDDDKDPRTCFSYGQGLPTDGDGVHFSGEAFREIGKYVSMKYLSKCEVYKGKRQNLKIRDEDLWTTPYDFKEETIKEIKNTETAR